jgi:proton-translocating NADH-quinone oxidoreductase chain L
MFILLVFLPFFAFLMVAFFGRFLGHLGSIIITTGAVFWSMLLSWFSFYYIAILQYDFSYNFGSWFSSGLFVVDWCFFFDTLTVVMLVVVTTISFLVHFYSIEYMSEDPHVSRFFSYLSLFTFFMLILVSSDNLILFFVGWEGVGLCSFLLINFWYTRYQANKSALKAVIVNRIGDIALCFAIIILYNLLGTVNISEILLSMLFISNTTFYILGGYYYILDFIVFFLFIGVIGKSAQLFLHTWLPDAMEGPTPVSALIHAATMVTAGVFLLVRLSAIVENTYYMLSLITIVGALTSFFAATTGAFQNDLKKVIAYSTCSQLGYMVFACGLSNYSVAMFHLVNHAFFKALLFLSAGSVIHAMSDEQDMRRMGGLHKILPFTYICFIIGSLALMGFPFTAGYYSKEFILEVAYVSYTFVGDFAYILGILSAFFTAFYSARVLYLTFLRLPAGYKSVYEHAHEPGIFMTFPLMFLALLSIIVGFLLKDMFIGLGTTFWSNSISIITLTEMGSAYEAEFLEAYIKIIPFILSIFGVVLAFCFYLYGSLTFFNYLKYSWFRSIYIFFSKKWLFDLIYNRIIVLSFFTFAYHYLFKIIDRGLLEKFGATGFYEITIYIYLKIKNIQLGQIFVYFLFMIFGIFLCFYLLIIAGIFLDVLFEFILIILFLSLYYFNKSDI